MKTVGVIGGIGPESTIEYYRQLIAAYRARKPDGSYPSIIINSIDMQKMLGLIEAGEFTQVTEYLVGEVRKLDRAGAACGLLAANTPHIVFDEISRQSPIPLVSIVEATCEAARSLGLKQSRIVRHAFHDAGPFLSRCIFQSRNQTCAAQLRRASLHSRQVHERIGEGNHFAADTRAPACDRGSLKAARAHRWTDPGGDRTVTDLGECYRSRYPVPRYVADSRGGRPDWS